MAHRLRDVHASVYMRRVLWPLMSSSALSAIINCTLFLSVVLIYTLEYAYKVKERYFINFILPDVRIAHVLQHNTTKYFVLYWVFTGNFDTLIVMFEKRNMGVERKKKSSTKTKRHYFQVSLLPFCDITDLLKQFYCSIYCHTYLLTLEYICCDRIEMKYLSYNSFKIFGGHLFLVDHESLLLIQMASLYGPEVHIDRLMMIYLPFTSLFIS